MSYFTEQTYDRALRNISAGSCAPIPFWEVSPVLSSAFPQMSVTTKTDTNKQLLAGLKNDLYQIIILSYTPSEEEYYSAKFLSEKMFLSVPQNHPFYTREHISPEELKGQFLIVFNEIGVWNDWIKKNFPGINLMLVNDSSALRDAIGLGAALSFVSDYIIRMGRNNKDQKIIPLELADNSIDYYLVCKKSEYSKYRKAIQQLITMN